MQCPEVIPMACGSTPFMIRWCVRTCTSLSWVSVSLWAPTAEHITAFIVYPPSPHTSREAHCRVLTWELHCAVNLDQCKEREWSTCTYTYVIQLLDGMHVKEGLAYDKHIGQLIGFVNLGEIKICVYVYLLLIQLLTDTNSLALLFLA